ncbi:MAG: hypothetical protein ABIV94_12485 [Acidimicrobiales bacterium]
MATDGGRSMRRLTIAVLAGMVALVGACGGGGGDDTDAVSSPKTTASTDAGTTGTTTASDPRSGESIATLTVAVDVERPNDQVTFDVQSLTVEGPTMVLRFSATPDFESEDDSTGISLSDVYYQQRAGAFFQLIDRVNLKEYSVIYDAPNFWMSDDIESLNGDPMFGYAVFAAPEDDLDVVDVVFRDNWPSLADVPITR